MPSVAEGATVRMYGFWRSQATFRVRVALHLKGVPFKEEPIDLDRGAQNSSSFRGVNPLGSVPALMVGSRALTQSMAILEYIEEAHREPALLPGDPLGRARVRSLAAIAASDAHPLIVPRVRRYLAEHGDWDAERWKAWQTHWFSSALRGLEDRLSSEPETGTFCHGDSPTFADICLAGLHAGAATFGIVLDGIGTVDRIVARCRTLDAFEAARADRQIDFPG